MEILRKNRPLIVLVALIAAVPLVALGLTDWLSNAASLIGLASLCVQLAPEGTATDS